MDGYNGDGLPFLRPEVGVMGTIFFYLFGQAIYVIDIPTQWMKLMQFSAWTISCLVGIATLMVMIYKFVGYLKKDDNE